MVLRNTTDQTMNMTPLDSPPPPPPPPHTPPSHFKSAKVADYYFNTPLFEQKFPFTLAQQFWGKLIFFS